MGKSFRVLFAALMLSGLVGLGAVNHAQAADQPALTDPTSLPVVGDVVGLLLASSGGSLPLLTEAGFPNLDFVFGLLNGDVIGVVNAIPTLEALEPVLVPVLGATGGLGLPLLDPATLGGTDAIAGLPIITSGGIIALPALNELPLVPTVAGLVGVLGGGGGSSYELPVVGLLATFNTVVFPLLTGGGGQ